MADHKRRGGLDGKENSAEEERGLHALFGDPEEAAFANPKEGALALADWSRGWGPNLLHHTRRVLGAGPIADFPLTDTGARTAVLLPGVWERWESLATWGRALHALGWNIGPSPRVTPGAGRQTPEGAPISQPRTGPDRRPLQRRPRSQAGHVGRGGVENRPVNLLWHALQRCPHREPERPRAPDALPGPVERRDYVVGFPRRTQRKDRSDPGRMGPECPIGSKASGSPNHHGPCHRPQRAPHCA